MYLGRIVELAPSRELNREPLHPYTVALLSAIPIPDPVVERRRRRIILKGDVPSPVNPPSGCRFHTRCWLRERLGNPERCSDRGSRRCATLSTGHEVACHFAEEVDGSAEQLQATGRAPRRRPVGRRQPRRRTRATAPAALDGRRRTSPPTPRRHRRGRPPPTPAPARPDSAPSEPRPRLGAVQPLRIALAQLAPRSATSTPTSRATTSCSPRRAPAAPASSCSPSSG